MKNETTTTTARRIETTRAARRAWETAPETEKETARRAYLTARAALLSVDFTALDGREMTELCAAATERAMQRRNAETAQDLPTMRRKYREDAEQETAARALEMINGAWIDGEYATARDEDGNPTETAPRREMPLALFAAHAAGRALDALIYADGGHAVKLTAREARENYDGDTRRTVTETRRTVDPVAPSPEAAAIRAEILPRILAKIDGDATRATAARILAHLYTGDSLTETAAALDISSQYARRITQTICNAAALVKVEDGERADLERIITSDRATRSNADRRAACAAAAALARDLATPAETETAPAVRWTAPKAPAARDLARMTYRERVTNYCDFSALARAIYAAEATRAE